MITEFKDEYSFLSNFYPCKVRSNCIDYLCSEAAYQAEKSTNPKVRQEFITLNGAQSKKHGKQIRIRLNWEDIKVDCMYWIVRAKFEQNPELAAKLLGTGSEEIVEGNAWHDTFWGQCPIGTGENHLGKILMRVRDELKGTVEPLIIKPEVSAPVTPELSRVSLW